MANFSKKYYFNDKYYNWFYYLCTIKMKSAPALTGISALFVSLKESFGNLIFV